ncbi:hypothetical protein AGOR_G00252690 [Albula goreensis]|uniref:Uncharacterized protein n=1 Tax=Albula goreensis TaxID=1534307 RepID=A0A8T3CAQ2_9TELE|nr:hypothetical protein AGOR_G00252690 [Albula goreensis]
MTFITIFIWALAFCIQESWGQVVLTQSPAQSVQTELWRGSWPSHDLSIMYRPSFPQRPAEKAFLTKSIQLQLLNSRLEFVSQRRTLLKGLRSGTRG